MLNKQELKELDLALWQIEEEIKQQLLEESINRVLKEIENATNRQRRKI